MANSTRIVCADAGAGCQILLLDEPFNAVDARTTYALLEVLRQCHQDGQAVIAVLHDYEQVRAYFATRCFWRVKSGRRCDGKCVD